MRSKTPHDLTQTGKLARRSWRMCVAEVLDSPFLLAALWEPRDDRNSKITFSLTEPTGLFRTRVSRMACRTLKGFAQSGDALRPQSKSI